MPKTSVPATPMPITGSVTRTSRSSVGGLARPLRPDGERVEDGGGHRPADEEERRGDVQHQQPLNRGHRASVRFAADGHARTPPASADRDDRGRQLDARPPGGAGARRFEGGGGARGGRLLRLPLRRAGRRARPAGDARHLDRRDVAAAADAARRGDHRLGRGGPRAGDARVAGAPRSALQELPEPARGRVRVDPRRADPHA